MKAALLAVALVASICTPATDPAALRDPAPQATTPHRPATRWTEPPNTIEDPTVCVTP